MSSLPRPLTASAAVNPRRVFTAPHPSAPRDLPPAQSTGSSVETLYYHPSVKIVAFTAGSRASSIGADGLAALDVKPGSLSWSSQLERTIAVGPFRIYRAPGWVAFLNCGTALQPILPKSQCWCVDELSSKFVLQVRRPQYWRIEIPVAEFESSRPAQELREVFDKILQFEKTECPFSRTFVVELPTRPETSVKKRPWTPVRKTVVQLPPTPVTPGKFDSTPGKTSQYADCDSTKALVSGSLNTARAKDDAEAQGSTLLANPAQDGENHKEKLKTIDPRFLRSQNDMLSQGNLPQMTVSRSLDAVPLRQRRGSAQTLRSVTAPPHLTIYTASPAISSANAKNNIGAESSEPPQSPTLSQDSFHSIRSWHSPLTPFPPSPPKSDPASPTTSVHLHGENLSLNETTEPLSSFSTATLTTPPTWTALSPMAESKSDEPRSLQLENISGAVPNQKPTSAESEHMKTTQVKTEVTLGKASITSSSYDFSASSTSSTHPRIGHRATRSSGFPNERRSLSPLPPAANIFTPRQQSNAAAIRSTLAVVRRLPMAVISKTCEILLSPPSHLMNLMVEVSRLITAGQWRGLVFGTGDSSEVKVQWDWSDEDDDGEGELGGWGADQDWHSPEPTRSIQSGSFPKEIIGSFPSDDDDNEARDTDGGADQADRDDLSKSWGVD